MQAKENLNSQLEKEAVAKGVPIGQTLDIDIPPPRPKRKPSNPYPRKTGVSSITPQVGAKDGKVSTSVPVPPCNHQVLDLEKEPPPEKPSVDEKSTGAKGNQDDSFSEVFIRSSSVYSLKKNAKGQKAGDHANVLSGDKMQSMQNCPEHIPVQILDGKTCTETPPSDAPCHKSIVSGGETQAQATVYSLLTTSAAETQNNVPPSSHQSFPPCHHPFTSVVRSQDDYRSFLQMSSTFLSLVVSTMRQNPASSFAASFWPFANVGNATDSPACTKGGLSSSPSLAAIAAATVAAATSWWAAHGLLPMCAPLQTAFACRPATTVQQSVHNAEVSDAKRASKKVNIENPPLNDERMELEAAQAQNSSSKLSNNCSSDCEENEGLKPNPTPKVADQETNATPPEVHDFDKSKNRKQVDRSSCGSNTASSSEVETDALEKNEKDKEEIKEGETNPPALSDSCRSRSNSNGSTSDSWKSVSQEGRLAFRALFSREVLPQSFSPPPKGESANGHHEEDNDEVQMPYVDCRNGDSNLLDLNSKTWCQEGEEKNPSIIPSCLTAIGVGNGKHKGFKPYKRCSVEAKENRFTATCSCQGEEKESKRICLGLEIEEASALP
ncbi:Protein LHY [Linum grandiflorum]